MITYFFKYFKIKYYIKKKKLKYGLKLHVFV